MIDREILGVSMAYPPCPVPPPPQSKKPKYNGYPRVECINGEKYYIYKDLVHTEKGYFKVTRRDEGESIFKDLLPLLLNEYNEFLKPHDFPIIGYANFFDIKIPVTTEIEKSFIKTAEESLKWHIQQHPRYKASEYVNTIYEDIHRLKASEIEWLNKHIVYKLDNKNTYLNIDSYFYS